MSTSRSMFWPAMLFALRASRVVIQLLGQGPLQNRVDQRGRNQRARQTHYKGVDRDLFRLFSAAPVISMDLPFAIRRSTVQVLLLAS